MGVAGFVARQSLFGVERALRRGCWFGGQAKPVWRGESFATGLLVVQKSCVQSEVPCRDAIFIWHPDGLHIYISGKNMVVNFCRLLLIN